jgi:transposase
VRIEDEKNVELLREKALLLARENQRLSKKMGELLQENLQLKGMTPQQLQQALSLVEEELAHVKSGETLGTASSEKRGQHEKPPEEKKTQTGHGPRAQPKLPIISETHEMDAADSMCPECGNTLAEWAGQEDTTEEIDVVERQFVMKKHLRKKYRCKCGCVESAEMPVRLVPGGRYSNDFAVAVAVAKYADGLPYERQLKQMFREGLCIETQTLWDQVEALAKALRGAWESLGKFTLQEKVIGFDETHWKVMTKGAAQKKTWTMWEVSSPRGIYFTIAPDGNAAVGNTLLKNFSGIAMCDAAQVHKSMAKTGSYHLAFCWAHARRKFIKAESSEPIRAKQFLAMVAKLYAIDAEAPAGKAGNEARQKLREEKSKLVIEEMKAWLLAQRFFPESDIGSAIQYVRSQWNGLTVFLTNAEVPLDNNRTERGFRGPAIGRNNFYGSHSKRGTEVAAILYSLVESAKINGVEVKGYFRRALECALKNERIPLPHECV